MKTSNRILLALGVFIFALPLFLSFALKNKLEKNEYVLDDRPHYEGNSSKRTLPSAPYSVVKVTGNFPDVFHVNLVADSAAYFNYFDGSSYDSVRTTLRSDTLFLDYATNQGNAYPHTNIRLSVPGHYNLVVDNAILNVKEYGVELDSLHIISQTNGVVQIGETDGEQKDSIAIRSLMLDASGGRVMLGNNTKIGMLQMNLKSNADLNVQKGAKVSRMEATMGEDVTIHAPLSFLKQLLK